jgi:Domain of unknown function (DUF4403)
MINITRARTAVGLYLFVSMIYGCARFTIPAPDAPVVPTAEPVVENSVINVPLTVSLNSMLKELGRLSSKDDKERPGRENVITGKIQEFLRRQASKNDNGLLQNRYLRRQAGIVWDALQSPVKLKDNVYLLINPQAVTVSLPATPGDTVSVVAKLVAKPRLVIGAPAPITAQPLPEMAMTAAQPETGFHIALESELPFDFLGRKLTKKMEGRAYPANGKTVIIEKVRLYGSGGSVVMAVSVRGTVTGTVYLTGMPAYDGSTRTLSVQNPEYTVETKQVLVQAADWLLHSGIRDGIAERATWFIGDRIDAEKDILTRALNRNLNEQVTISGKIYDLRPVSVGIASNAIRVILVADGTVDVNVF